jgi:hypothetical protein
MSERWTVELPREAQPPYRVFVSGVRQHEGQDYEVRGRTLAFMRPLAQEGRLGFWRWLSIFLGLVGTYRPHDSVDVHYTAGGVVKVAVELDVVPPAGAGETAAPAKKTG